MSYCLNPSCQKPQNPGDARFCSNCGRSLLLNHYRIQRPISQGGIGRTFLAVDESDPAKPRCVIKQFSSKTPNTNGNAQKNSELFSKEATKFTELGQHPQIPELLAYFEFQNQHYLVQSLIDGDSLTKILATEGAFKESEIKQLLDELLPVLQFIHEKGVIHRDINPENIIRRRRNNQLVLVDFSTAKVTTKTALAKTGTVIGSAAFTAPEQLIGQAVFSSDLYSLGVICIYLLTQIHPFNLFDSLEGTWVWQDYLIEPISPDLIQVLNKMIEGTVKNRYKLAPDVLKDLHPQGYQVQIPISYPNIPTPIPPGWNCISTLRGHLSSVNALVFTSKENTIISGSADKTVKVWNLNNNINRCTLSGHLSLIDTLALNAENTKLASGSWDYTIRVWDLKTEELIYTLAEHSGWIQSLTISPKQPILVSGSADKTIKIWNLETGELQFKLLGHTSAIQALAISPDGDILASGSADKTIKLWKLATGEFLGNLEGHTDGINSLIFSPGKKILNSASNDRTIKTWRWESKELISTLQGHEEAVRSIAISNQGNILVSGSADKTVKIWHPGSSELLYTLAGHTAGVTSVAISPDGWAIASGSQDKTIKIWRFE